MHSPNGDGLEAVTNGNEVVRVPQVVLLLRHHLRSTTVSLIRSNKATHWIPAVGSALDPDPRTRQTQQATGVLAQRAQGEGREVRGPWRSQARCERGRGGRSSSPRTQGRGLARGFASAGCGRGGLAGVNRGGRRAARGWKSLFRNYLTADMVTRSIARSYGWLSLRSLSYIGTQDYQE